MNSQNDIEKFYTKDLIKQEFEQSLSARVERYMKVKPHGIVPLTKFAPVSAESTYLFRDGHYYGAIALSQVVAEAIVKFLCEKNSCNLNKDFEKNIKTLHKRKLIQDELKDKFLKIWKNRHDYHHLNPAIETDRGKLEDLAYSKILLLKDIESEIFKFSYVDGKIKPDKAKYWDIQENGTIPIYLKLD